MAELRHIASFHAVLFITAMALTGCANINKSAQPAKFTDINKISVQTKSVRTISKDASIYHGWPTVTKMKNGSLLAVYSGGRELHICPFGRVEMMRSVNDGRTWSAPVTLVDSPLDDRDAGIVETGKGTILVTWFTSTYWTKQYEKMAADVEKNNKINWPMEKFQRWQKAKADMTAANCKYPEMKLYMEKMENGDKSLPYPQWLIRSEDGGKTWSQPYMAPLMAPHGPICTSDGRLLWAGKTETVTQTSRIALAESFDDGKTWEIVSHIPAHPEQDSAQYHELHLVDCADGSLLVQIRNHDKLYSGQTLQTESYDGGKTWTTIHSINVWGHPSHLLRLADDTLVMTYGYRGLQNKPIDNNCNYARFSADCGKTWSKPYYIDGNYPTIDFGYPSTTVLSDGSFLTLWYQELPGNKMAQLVQAVWTAVP